jgi:uncharacterized protein
MFISLQQLEQRAVTFDVSVPVETIEYDGKLNQASVLEAQGTAELLSASLGEIRVQGKLKVTMAAPCDRCLETAEVKIERKFDLVYLPEAEGHANAGEEIEAAAIEVGYYDGPGLELNDVLREVVMLAAPMQVVCQESCRGICPYCGQNRNQRECDCRSELADDRWSKLRSLKVEIGPRN